MSDDEEARKRMAERLRQAREYLGLSQEEVATRLNVPRSAISLIETARRKIDALELKRFAELYQRPVSDLAGETTSPSEPPQLEILKRTASELKPTDQEEVLRFAEFLRARARREKDK